MTAQVSNLPPRGTPEFERAMELEIESLALTMQLARGKGKTDLRSRVAIPQLYPIQAQIKAQATRYNILCIGRRAGKTYLATHLILETALTGNPAAWFVPDYKTAAEVWRELTVTLRPIATKSNATERRIELPNGGVIEVWTLENEDAARGRKYKRVVVDEAAMARNLQVAWEQSIRPTLADLKGDAWFLSTPKGLNYFYDLYKRGIDPVQTEWKSWQLPSSVNPFLDPGEIDAQREGAPELAFRQEWEAEFLSADGAVFRGVDQILIHDTPYPREHAGHVTVAGVDWGQQNDFTAISVFCCTCKREVFLDRFNKIDWHFQRGRLLATIAEWGIKDTLCEINSIGSPNLEALQREAPIEITGKVRPVIRGFQTTMRSKGDIIRALALAIEKKTAYFLYDEVGKHELISYEMTLSESGNAKYSAVEGSHDDTVIARALALNAAEKYWVIRPTLSESINAALPATWQDAYLDKLNNQDPVMAQRFYDARRATYDEIRTEKLNKRRPQMDYSGDPDMGAGRDGWSE